MGNPRPMAVWEVVAEVACLLRRHCHPRRVRGHRLSRAAALRSTRRRLSRDRSGRRGRLLTVLDAQGPEGEAESLQKEQSLWAQVVAVSELEEGTG